MTRRWLLHLPLIAATIAGCGPKEPKSPTNIALSAAPKSAEPPPLGPGPSWAPANAVAGVHVDTSLSCREKNSESGEAAMKRCTSAHPPESRVDGELNATGLPVTRPLSLAQGHCYQLWITIGGGIADAQIALVDARGHFAAASDAPAPTPTLTARTLAVPHDGALCIDSPTELSLSAAAGSGTGKFEATLHRVK